VIERVAVAPHLPLLVPELVVADDPDVRAVRDACLAVAAELAAAAPRWIVIGAAEVERELGPDAAGTFLGYGVDIVTRLGSNDATLDPAMPLPALVAGWLREQVGAEQVPTHLIPTGLPAAECRAFGARLAEDLAGEPVGLLILGDGSHRHGERAPWQVLAGAVAGDGRRWKSTDARQLVPFGVAYHLAVWDPIR
jgi:hypothetical protein